MRQIKIKSIFLADQGIEDITSGVIHSEIHRLAAVYNEAAANGNDSLHLFYEFTGFLAGLRFANILVTWDFEKIEKQIVNLDLKDQKIMCNYAITYVMDLMEQARLTLREPNLPESVRSQYKGALEVREEELARMMDFKIRTFD